MYHNNYIFFLFSFLCRLADSPRLLFLFRTCMYLVLLDYSLVSYYKFPYTLKSVGFILSLNIGKYYEQYECICRDYFNAIYSNMPYYNDKLLTTQLVVNIPP